MAEAGLAETGLAETYFAEALLRIKVYSEYCIAKEKKQHSILMVTQLPN